VMKVVVDVTMLGTEGLAVLQGLARTIAPKVAAVPGISAVSNGPITVTEPIITTPGISGPVQVKMEPSTRELEQIRSSFRKLLVKRHYSPVCAWCALDPRKRGRLSYIEFCRSCNELGFNGNVRKCWEALDVDRSGFVSLHEVFPREAQLLGELAVCVWGADGSVEQAWKNRFNRKGIGRASFEDFARGCEQIGFQGDPNAAYAALNCDFASTGLCESEFMFLDLWFTPELAKAKSPFNAKAAAEMTSSRRRVSLALAPKPKKGPTPKQQFKKLLLASYGNYLRAWRQGLDRDHSGLLDWKEFTTACADVGYAGPRKELWEDLDKSGTGNVTLEQLDEAIAQKIDGLSSCALKKTGSWTDTWRKSFDVRGDDRVPLRPFIEGCRVVGWGGDAESLFNCLDMDSAGYLTLKSTQWIAGEGEDLQPKEKVWQSVVTKGTSSYGRYRDFKDRDIRLTSHRFASRDRGQIPGCLPSSPKLQRTTSDLGSSLGGSMSAQALDCSPKSTLARADEVDPWELLHRGPMMPEKGPVSMKRQLTLKRTGGQPRCPSSPGSGGWTKSNLGLARAANRSWRDEECDEEVRQLGLSQSTSMPTF